MKFHITLIHKLEELFRLACAQTTHSHQALHSYILPNGSIRKLYHISHRHLVTV
ncbi:MAG: hypothetical protein WCG25_06530 [bacterium]